MEEVYIIGVGMTPFGKLVQYSVKDITRMAVEDALKDAGCDVGDIQGAFFANQYQSLLEGKSMLRGPINLSAMGFERIPCMTMDNACAGGTTAFWNAVNFIRAGRGDVALAVGVEKMNYPGEHEKVLETFRTALDLDHMEEHMAWIRKQSEGVEIPPDSESPKRSFFMDIYAARARARMREYGLTQRQIACICAKNHNHSQYNEKAFYRTPFTVEEVMAARPIVYPLTLPMCAPTTDGGAAVIVASREGITRLKADPRRAVKVAASVLLMGNADKREDYHEEIGCMAAKRAYEEASVGPEDMSLCECHDATAFSEVVQAETLGFCARGEGGRFAEEGNTAIGGRIPINPSGGLESKGHPIAATGCAQLYEMVTQLRGEAGKRQVEGARFAIQENGGGKINILDEEGVIAITILQKPE